jgi:glycosyltransferase involved in cell wall biosynthesis
MRLAIVTNEFPSSICTFFARDVRSLLAAGLEVDIYPIYPLDPALWAHVPALLDERAFPRDRVHHLPRARVIGTALPRPAPGWRAAAGLAAPFVADAMRYGAASLAKTLYAAACGAEWARRIERGRYEHVLAYWGSYVATAAAVFRGLAAPSAAFSMFARARADLYSRPVGLVPALRQADNIFLVCEYNRGYLAERYPRLFPAIADRIQVHYSGLPLEDMAYQPEGREKGTIVAVGRLEALKGFAVLLRALAELVREGRDVRLDLVGRGEEEVRLRALAAELGIEAHVRFSGHLPPDEAIRAMRRAELLVHPPVERDAMPNVLKEALTVGTPAIASDLAGAPEILDHGRCGLLVPPGDVHALAGAMRRLLDDGELRRRLADAGRRHMEGSFDLWRNGEALAARLRATRRAAAAEEAAHAA